jgi:very-short-patch-repair endonuclease
MISDLEAKLAFQMKAVLLAPEREYRFCPWRQYRADFAFPEQKLLIEAEGGLFSKGKGWHLSIGGYLDDLAKYNLACLMGYRVLRFTAKEINSGKALNEIECALAGGLKFHEQGSLDLRLENMGS